MGDGLAGLAGVRLGVIADIHGNEVALRGVRGRGELSGGSVVGAG